MANELHAHDSTGKTLYAVLLSSTGQAAAGTAFEAINGANWTTYDIALTEAAAGIYLATMPAVAAGVYSYAVYEQAGASPAVTDKLRGLGSIDWDGSAEIGNSALATLVGSRAAPGDAMTLAETQGDVTFGQVKILADAANEGALEIVNSNAHGIGLHSVGTQGNYNEGVGAGSTGQVNFGEDIGQSNHGDAGYGQYNSGEIADIQGNLVGTVNGLTATAQADVRTAAGLAAANLDTQLTNAAETLTAIKAKTDTLTTGTVILTTPVTVSGDVLIDQGYDYYTADGRGLSWTDETPATWPNLSGATATLRVGGLAITGTITNPTGPATITVELNRTQTASLAVGVHRFKIDATLANTHLILQIRGDMIVS